MDEGIKRISICLFSFVNEALVTFGNRCTFANGGMNGSNEVLMRFLVC